MIFVGDDWSKDRHDVCVEDDEGTVVAAESLPAGIEGIRRFHELVAPLADDPSEVMVCIETDRGLWVGALVASGYRVYAPNPLAVSRFREVRQLSGAKSDAADAKLLADLVRSEWESFRPVAGDSDLAEGIGVLTRAHQRLIWDRNRHSNRLWATLREYFPQAVAVWDEIEDRDAWAIVKKASTPQAAKRLSISQIEAALRRSGRSRQVRERAEEVQPLLRTEGLEAPLVVAEALATTAKALVEVIGVISAQITVLEAELDATFGEHPDTPIIRSLPGLGTILGARVLGEFGDDPNRYATAKSRKNYAATSPITVASGNSRIVTARHVKNRHLADALFRWAEQSIRFSPGARAFYDQQRATDRTYNAALIALANRWVGILHGCLTHRTLYDEDTAWAHRQTAAA